MTLETLQYPHKIKSLWLLIAAIMMVMSCSKKDKGCTPVKPEDEDAQISAYIVANSINATKHSRGIYYEIEEEGTGERAVSTSKVFVTYSGRLLNGTLFDEKVSPINFYLNEVIEGWQIGLPLIKEGGRIRLIIPSSYAYGCNGSGSIPANSVLDFNISLIDVQ